MVIRLKRTQTEASGVRVLQIQGTEVVVQGLIQVRTHARHRDAASAAGQGQAGSSLRGRVDEWGEEWHREIFLC